MRLAEGGRIDRSVTLHATLDGRPLTGHPGDTLASALLAAGRIEVAPSIYRGRPRGIVAAGPEEPNALVGVHGPHGEPLLPATTVPLAEGLSARLLSGVGRLEPGTAAGRHDKSFGHADVLVVGAGPAGLAAALAASAGGARVVLADEGAEPGGRLLAEPPDQPGSPGPGWPAAALAELAGRPEVRVLTRTCAFSLERTGGTACVLLDQQRDGGARRLWQLRVARVVVATGALQRPLVFAGNDRPGVMLAAAVSEYLHRYAVLPGRRAVVATVDDSGHRTALDLHRAGVEVAAVLDTRPASAAADAVRAEGIEVFPGTAVARALGERRVRGVVLEDGRRLDCDLLAVSGGWSPTAHLYSQARGVLRWDDGRAAFLPDGPAGCVEAVGAAAGRPAPADCLADGVRAGLAAARDLGHPGRAPELPSPGRRAETPPLPRWLPDVPDPARDEQFVDLQRDTTVADVARAVRAGMRSVEHVKRYTTAGTGIDQGRTSGVLTAGVTAALLGLDSPGALGTTTFRAPFRPVPFALLAGRSRGALHDPVRTTPMHGRHEAAGAVFEDVGQWKRPWYYPRDGEDRDAAVARECRAVRTAVGAMDVSTLGRIDVVGEDAAEFLNRLYTNPVLRLAVGAARYGLLCTADGMVFDDGVLLRLAEDHFHLTTTTGNAAAVLDWFEEWSQTEWPELDVACTSVTEQWATVAVAGPSSRAVLAALAPGLDCSAEAFAFMTAAGTVLAGGIPARVARVSFSGELAYEVSVPAWYGLALWDAVLAAGEPHGITPYGTETMHVLRAEKGYPIVGQDTDGTVTPYDLGMGWAVSRRKSFVGQRSLDRPDTAREGRRQLVGLLPERPGELLPEGAQLIAPGVPVTPERGPVPMLGHVTSSYRSATLGRGFALALLAGGRERIGQTVLAPLGDRTVPATVTEPVFYDPEGARRDG
jgi:sarcosine oxidase, subunit alpha